MRQEITTAMVDDMDMSVLRPDDIIVSVSIPQAPALELQKTSNIRNKSFDKYISILYSTSIVFYNSSVSQFSLFQRGYIGLVVVTPPHLISLCL